MGVVTYIKDRLKPKPKETSTITINLQEDFYNVGYMQPKDAINFSNYLQGKYPEGGTAVTFIDPITMKAVSPQLGVLSIVTLVKDKKDIIDPIPLIVTQFGDSDFYVNKEWWDLYKQGKVTLN